MIKIAIVIGSTRQGTVGTQVAAWVHSIVQGKKDVVFEIVNVADYRLPLLGETQDQSPVQKWSQKIASFDGYIFTVAEYNHSVVGSLKNAIDLLKPEWENKAAAIVSYGYGGGARAAEHLRGILSSLHVGHVRKHVMLDLATDFVDKASKLAARPFQTKLVLDQLNELVDWTNALKTLRK